MNTSTLFGYLTVGLIGLVFGLCEGVKDMRVSVPQVIRRGETAVLMCDFDLEGDSLYSVKWYKGKSEFFRYTPKDEFPIKVFPIEGLRLEESKSNMTKLTLENVQPNLSGRYSCEVSAESSFHTGLKSAVMDVVGTATCGYQNNAMTRQIITDPGARIYFSALRMEYSSGPIIEEPEADVPEIDPVLEGVQSRYKVGDMLSINCTSGKSNPPVNITWYVNDRLASPSRVSKFKNDLGSGSLASSKSNIQFVVTTHDFPGGHLRIRCLATLHNIYHRSTDVVIDEDNPFTLDSTQVVVASANFQDATHESNQRKRYYSDDSGSKCSSDTIYIPVIISAMALADNLP